MKTILKTLLVLGSLLLIGCGGGGSASGTNEETTSTTELDTSYVGEKSKAKLDENNYLKYIKYLHYMFLNDLNDNTYSLEDQNGKMVEEHIDNDTGLGYLLYTYSNFQVPYSEEVWTGTVKIDITEVNRATGLVKSNNTFDIKVESFDEEFSIFLRHSTEIDTESGAIIALKLKEFRVTNELNQEQIEVINLNTFSDSVGSEQLKGRMFISSEGYVDFSTTSDGYVITGESNSNINVDYKDHEHIDVVLNNIENKKLFYQEKRVSSYKFLAINNKEIKLNNRLDDTNLSVEHDVNINLVTDQAAKWYVNGQKIDDVNITKLSRKYFKKTDTIKVVFGVYNRDACSVAVIENYEVPNSEPIVTIKQNNDDPRNSAYIVNTNSLEFTVDYFNIFDADGDRVNLRWSPSYGEVEIVPGTEMDEHPTVVIPEYGIVRIEVSIEEERGWSYTELIWLDVRSDIFESQTLRYSYFNGYSDVQAVSVGDMNGDDLKDIIVMIQGAKSESDNTTSNNRRLEIFYQSKDNQFSLSKIIDVGEGWHHTSANLIVKDINNDGFLDIAINRKYSAVSSSDEEAGGIEVYVQDGDGNFSKYFHQKIAKSVESLISCDINRDGSSDYVALVDTNGWSLGELNIVTLSQNTGAFDINTSMNDELFGFDSQLKLGDFNGDGLEDLLIHGNANNPVFYTYGLNDTLYKKQYLIQDDIENRYIGFNATFIRDFNDDGYDDIIFGVGKSYAGPGLNRYEDMQKDIYVMYSSGESGLLEPARKIPIELEVDYEVLSSGDMNKDQHQDFVAFKDEYLTVYMYEDGNYFKYPNSLHAPENFDMKHERMVVTDINDDGKADVVIAPDSNALVIGISKL